jgi:hypothetical protein
VVLVERTAIYPYVVRMARYCCHDSALFQESPLYGQRIHDAVLDSHAIERFS